jgi:hypothetical protein
MDLKTFCGDSITLTIPLSWRGAPVVPVAGDILIFTVKADLDDADASALIQKATGAGITIDGTTAFAAVALVYEDTATLAAGTTYYDVQWQDGVTGEIKTLAAGRLELKRDATRLTTTSVPVYTTEAPIPGGEELTESAILAEIGTDGRIRAELMPEVIPNVLLELADVSALETALPLGTLGRDENGVPVYGDGATIPGVTVGTGGDDGATKYRGQVTITGAELGTAITGASKLLFEFPITAAQAVNGTVIRCRGKAIMFPLLGTAASIPASRIGMITPAGLALAGGAVNSKLSGVVLPTAATTQANGTKPVNVDFDFGLLINTESAALKLSEVADPAQVASSFWSTGDVFTQTGNNAANVIVASAVVTAITPATAFSMGFYFGNAADVTNLGDWTLRYEIEIEIIAP